MTALLLALGTASSLGLSRFAYGLLVPGMADDLGWSLAEVGLIGTANGFGYLIGAATTAHLVRRTGNPRAFRWAMVMTAVTLTASATSGDLIFQAVVRSMAGAAGAVVFITGGVIASQQPSRMAVPIYFAGTGVGIVFASLTIPAIGGEWRLGWLLLGIAAAAATLFSWAAAGRGTDVPQGTGRARIRPMWGAALAYFLFAAGYITYITFLSAFLVERETPPWLVMLFWAALGAAVIAAPVIWSRALSAWPVRRVLVALLAVLSGGAGLALVSPAPIVMFASVLIYGGTFMGVPAAITALIKTSVSPSNATATLSTFTVVFALGQFVGPWLAGRAADTGWTGATLAWTAVLSALAALTALLALRRRPAEPPLAQAEPTGDRRRSRA